MASTRYICLHKRNMAPYDISAENQCTEFSRLIGTKQECGNCRFLTHEGSERYGNFVRANPGILPERLPDVVKVIPDRTGHKFVAIRTSTYNMKKPYIEIMERIRSDPNFYPKGVKQKKMVDDLLDTCYIYDTATMVPADQLTYEKTIALFNANPDKRERFTRCHSKTPEAFFSEEQHHKPDHYQHFLLAFKIEVKE